MTTPTPLLMTAGNGHNWITFEDYDTPQWVKAIEWLEHEGFERSGTLVRGLDEAILPSYVKKDVTVAAGFDNWAGHYLLAECDNGDQVILAIANHVAAIDRRGTA